MSSPQFVTLFAQSDGRTRSRASLVFSVLLHGVGIAGLSVGILENPRIVEARGPAYSVQMVHMKAPEPDATDPTHDGIVSPVPGHVAESNQSGPPLIRPAMHKARVSQVLLQPNAPVVEVEQAIVPSLLIVSPKQIAEVRQIAPPAPAPEAQTPIHPVIDLPAAETPLADVQIASSSFTSEKLHMAASSTSPVAAQGATQQGPAPQSRSEAVPNTASARVLSLSDLQVKSGSFVLPHVSTSPSHSGEVGGASASTGSTSRNSGTATTSAPTPSTASIQSTSGNGSSELSAAASGLRHITLPKDGKFEMVLVGNSVEESYPETVDTWRGRPAYTVYLHVGLAKSWILQYSVPSSAQAAASGSMARLEAPWPVDMLVPNLDALSVQDEALIVHGFLTSEGRFDQLTMILPPRFAASTFMLDALKKWLFRPATQNGQPTAIEILLIIPDQEL